MLISSFGFYVSNSMFFIVAIVLNVLLYLVSISLDGSTRKIFTIISMSMTGILIVLSFIEIIGSYVSSGKHKYDIYVYYLIALLLICVVCAILYDKLPNKYKVLCYIIPSVLVVASLILFKPTSDDGDLSTSDRYYLIISALLTLAVLVLAFLKDKRQRSSTRSVVYGAICISLSMVLSYLKLWSMPQGGSLTFASMLPIMLFAYIFGTRKGIIIGAIYGVLQFLQNPYFMNIYQFALDYTVAFACLGLAGLGSLINKNIPISAKFAIGCTLGGIMRYVCHVLSGIFAFGMWAPEGQGAFVYSTLYNIFVLPDTAIVVLVGVVMLSSRSFVAQLPMNDK